MRILVTYVVAGLICFVGMKNGPSFKVYPLNYYSDTATLAYFIFGTLGCLSLWSRQDFVSLFQLVSGKSLSPENAQLLLIRLENTWKILCYGTLLVSLVGLNGIMYDIYDMARLGGTMALSILIPLYLLILRWWVVGPMMQSLKKAKLADAFEI
jgi:hypothetical protein